MLVYSAVGFKLSAVSPELTLSLTQLSADLAGCTGRCWCNSFTAGHMARCSNFLVERALYEYGSFPAVFPARALRFPPVSASAAAAALAGGHERLTLSE